MCSFRPGRETQLSSPLWRNRSPYEPRLKRTGPLRGFIGSEKQSGTDSPINLKNTDLHWFVQLRRMWERANPHLNAKHRVMVLVPAISCEPLRPCGGCLAQRNASTNCMHEL